MSQDTYTGSDKIGDVLLTKIQGDITELFTAVAAATSGSGVLVSSTDTTIGTLITKLVEGTSISLTQNDVGGNETLSVDIEIGENQNYNGHAILNSGIVQANDATVSTGTYTLDGSAANAQKITATGDFALAVEGWPSGIVCAYALECVNWGAHNITLPSSWQFESKTGPEFTSSGTDHYLLKKDKEDVFTLLLQGVNVGVTS